MKLLNSRVLGNFVFSIRSYMILSDAEVPASLAISELEISLRYLSTNTGYDWISRRKARLFDCRRSATKASAGLLGPDAWRVKSSFQTRYPSLVVMKPPLEVCPSSTLINNSVNRISYTFFYLRQILDQTKNVISHIKILTLAHDSAQAKEHLATTISIETIIKSLKAITTIVEVVVKMTRALRIEFYITRNIN